MTRREAIQIDPAEIAAQQAFIGQIAALPGRPQTYHLVTYGCQMNARDSQTLAGMFEGMGLSQVEELKQAHVVLYNTCCIRDNAQRRALGNVTWLKELKKQNPGLIICVSGCMMQQEGMAQTVLARYPFVDVAFGTHNLHRFPELLHRALSTRAQVVEVIADDEGHIAEGLPVRRESPFKAFITIMTGCNNFCSYCIVPYVRGRERSREAEAILQEARSLRAEGVQEITLLGQNVNSYGSDLVGGVSFPKLLAQLDQVGIPRIRFMTSHPKDLSDELIEVMAQGKHICPHVHLPVQSGSDRVLLSMNRKYTREHYLARVAALRQHIPGISLTTDLIVAYPGETQQDFEDTLSLVEAVRYDAAFTFIYSPRKGTAAAGMTGTIHPDVARERILQLIETQKRITAQQYAQHIGSVQPVLVEAVSKRSNRQVAGKTGHNIHVNLTGDASLIGSIVPVRIEAAGENTLKGTLAAGDKEN